MIPWDAASTEVLLNPRLPTAERDRVRARIAGVPPLPAHVWLTTSGSMGRHKPVALAKRALLASAAAVNRHLASDARDVWLAVLPTFHVGGLGIHARAHLSGARVVTLAQWDPAAFAAAAATHGATLSALVPAQVFDLIRAHVTSPDTLRAVVVGGGRLAAPSYHAARTLGWPLLPSYGATECASQIATASLASLAGNAVEALQVLPHLFVRTDPDGRLAVRGASLLTGYAGETGLEDPKRDGWWRTDDRGETHDGWLTVTGRADETFKVGGELVALRPLEDRLAAARLAADQPADAALVVLPDPRLGWAVHLVVATREQVVANQLLRAFNAGVAPYERARSVRCVRAIPRTALGKVARSALEALIGG